jgi:hypothetical protein
VHGQEAEAMESATSAGMTSSALVSYDRARSELEKAYRLEDVKKIRVGAEALRAVAKVANDRDMQNWAAEIRFRAEVRAGELLAEMEKNRGTRGNFHGRDGSGAPVKVAPEETLQTLKDLGITYNQSSRWQALAAVSEEVREEAITTVKQQEEFTTAAVMDVIARIEPELEDPLKRLGRRTAGGRPKKRGPYLKKEVEERYVFGIAMRHLRAAQKRRDDLNSVDDKLLLA